MISLPGPLPCDAVNYKNYFHLKLFEILYGTNIHCLREGVFINKFIIHIGIIITLLLVTGLLIKRLPQKNRYKKKLKKVYLAAALFLLIIFLVPIFGITINRISFIIKYGYYGDKSESIFNFINW
jgi:NhaP-type Na+/H+ or K+/H+ antiporter